MQNIQEFFVEKFNSPILETIFIAMLPIFELRGAIPFAMSTSLWGDKALSIGTAFLVSFIGSSIIIPLVALLFKPFLIWLKNSKLFKNIALKLENRINQKGKSFENKNSKLKKMLGIIFFVGVPLPLTGAYTGTALAVTIGLNFYDTLLSVLIGNLIAGVVIALLSSVTENAANIMLLVFILTLLIVIATYFIKFLIKTIKNKKENV